MENCIKQLTTGALIDAYHNEASLWDTYLNASESEKELAWMRLATQFNVGIGKFLTYSCSYIYMQTRV
jgi:hypothetical protein